MAAGSLKLGSIFFSVLRPHYFWHFQAMFKHQIQVAYRDVTVGNHVYYARYLDFFEIARNEVFRSLGHTLAALQAEGVMLPVVECSLRYHGAARYDDSLEIETTVTEIRRVQVSFSYRVLREGTLLVSGTTRHAVTTLEEKPMRMPAALQEALECHLQTEEDSI